MFCHCPLIILSVHLASRLSFTFSSVHLCCTASRFTSSLLMLFRFIAPQFLTSAPSVTSFLNLSMFSQCHVNQNWAAFIYGLTRALIDSVELVICLPLCQKCQNFLLFLGSEASTLTPQNQQIKFTSLLFVLTKELSCVAAIPCFK